MNKNALDKIRKVKKKYIIYYLLADACLASAIALAGDLILVIAFGASYFYSLALFAVAFILFIVYRRLWLIHDEEVAGFLDASYPELEESSSLLLMKPAELNLLQNLQVNKVAETILQVPSNHQHFTKRLRLNVLWLIGALILTVFVNKINYHRDNYSRGQSDKNTVPKSFTKEIMLPQIESVSIVVSPPAYTRLKAYSQHKLMLETVEGALAGWKLKTDAPVQKVSLLFNGQENLAMTNPVKDKTVWTAKKTITRPGFYQVMIDGKLSDLYQVQVIKDSPPSVQIKTPNQYTYIDAGEQPRINLNALVTDDYGVSDAAIFATVAKGSGEAVKFKEQKIIFPVSFSKMLGSYDLQKTIDLHALGMEAGDELYFYVEAHDNHSQLGRSGVLIVSIQDTAQLLSMDGILSGANVKPEYFRSERQIIIDAEALLKGKGTLSQDNFKDRSNDLGTDQKLLRLRYGKFLGEEAEGNIADPRLEGKELADPKDFGNGAKIIDEYTDKHDNAEDAQFFDPTVKAQLKATLTEMWKAELQLRLYNPQEALPFAYKALRLLKDLQQKSRSYVAKTAYNPSPLKMEKRLSGDLSKILKPLDHEDIKQAGDHLSELKITASLLQQLSQKNNIDASYYRLLQAANRQIDEKAMLQPGIYLAAASAMRRIMTGNKKNLTADIATVETAIQKILPAIQALPQPLSSASDMGFSKAYFLKLNRVNR